MSAPQQATSKIENVCILFKDEKVIKEGCNHVIHFNLISSHTNSTRQGIQLKKEENEEEGGGWLSNSEVSCSTMICFDILMSSNL